MKTKTSLGSGSGFARSRAPLCVEGGLASAWQVPHARPVGFLPSHHASLEYPGWSRVFIRETRTWVRCKKRLSTELKRADKIRPLLDAPRFLQVACLP